MKEFVVVYSYTDCQHSLDFRFSNYWQQFCEERIAMVVPSHSCSNHLDLMMVKMALTLCMTISMEMKMMMIMVQMMVETMMMMVLTPAANALSNSLANMGQA